MSAHALLSPSGAHRWLNCTKAPRTEATLPEQTSIYAEEGTLAHSVCELAGKKRFRKIKPAEYNKELKKLKKDPLWAEEMLGTADIFVGHLEERAMQFFHAPYVAFESKVDLTDYVPESFGRCDCIMFGGDTLVITDYKHGKGIPVSAEQNPQLLLYAVGALKLYYPIFGNAIHTVEICVDQPRLQSYSCWSLPVDDLLHWCEAIKPTAEQAFQGEGEFHSGEWCRFCRAKGSCQAQATQQLGALEEFFLAANNDALLNPEDLGKVLERGATLVTWYEAVKEAALTQLLQGTEIPGWKAVEGRSSRAWTDQDKALEAIEASGYDRALIYDTVAKSLSKLEKELGTTKFREIAGTYVKKPPGKPTLAPESDPRKPFSPAVSDFASVATNKGE